MNKEKKANSSAVEDAGISLTPPKIASHNGFKFRHKQSILLFLLFQESVTKRTRTKIHKGSLKTRKQAKLKNREEKRKHFLLPRYTYFK